MNSTGQAECGQEQALGCLNPQKNENTGSCCSEVNESCES